MQSSQVTPIWRKSWDLRPAKEAGIHRAKFWEDSSAQNLQRVPINLWPSFDWCRHAKKLCEANKEPHKRNNKEQHQRLTQDWEYGKSTIYRPVRWAKNSSCHLKPFRGGLLLQNNLSWLVRATFLGTAAPRIQRPASETLCQEGRRMTPHVFITAVTNDWSEWVVKLSSPLLEG